MSLTRCVNLFAAALAVASLTLGGAAAWAQAAAPDQPPAPAPQPPPPQQISGGVAALVNDDVISTYDLRQRALLLILTAGVPATPENMPQIQNEALRSLIDEHLELQELRKMERDQKFEIVADDKEVDEALTSIAADNNSTLPQLANQFARAGLDLQTLRDQIRVQISWQRMITGRYGTRVRIGENQIAMALQRLKASSDKPRFLVSEIFIDAARAGGVNEAVNGAQQLINQIQQGAPFGPVARQFSSAPSAASGGDMGWVTASELTPELATAVEQMRPGQMSEPIPVNDGVYILQLRDRRAGGGTMTVTLKQAAARLPQDAPADQVDTARATLESFRAAGATCTDLESKAAGFPGIVAGDLGQSELADLTPDFREPAQSLPIGQFSTPIRSAVGLHLIMVCDRKESQANAPSRAEIENRLHGEQLAMLSRRYLRDLRNSATIETP